MGAKQEENMLFKWIEATQLNCVSLRTIICGSHFKPTDYTDLKEETDSAEEDSYMDFREQCNSDGVQNIAADIQELEILHDEGFLVDAVIEQIQNNVDVIESTNECSKVDKEIQTDTDSTKKCCLLNLLKTDTDLQAFAGISFCTLEALTKAINLIKKKTVQLLAAVLEETIYIPNKEEIIENLPVNFFGTAPSGLIIFGSKCYGGRASDKAIFMKGKILQKMTPGEDAFMVDMGFMIKSECQACNVKLYMPPFASSQNVQKSMADSLKTREIVAARVHVERIMGRLKNFKIMKSTITWELAKYMDKIVIIICGLVNLSTPIISKQHYSN
ncbi:hypothetical protein TSAR_007985 [Trichomalopsis sarcophagae]|uniref:DDE Tnp4 domain-containing protein n=1 Tax=Trichomalopsis sarcophagae TaxID=543379 RepID=A0A232FN82_9HYME|nr:hypothetical protein TSAR_007985 [Trichomalopsis sarcophagae]